MAATKTHLAQIVALEILALYLAELRARCRPPRARALLADMAKLPELDRGGPRRGPTTSPRWRPSTPTTRDFFFLGRHVGYPVAMEGALKLKEISYLRAEGYPAGELKHGPIALIEPGHGGRGRGHPHAAVGQDDGQHRRGAQPRRHRGAGGQRRRRGHAPRQADDVLWVPRTHPLLAPVVDVVPLQLFAYNLARLHGHDVDRPRNLAKTVTVE